MSAVRILTVRQPWAWAIIHGGKDVENRVRNIAGDYRGPVAIHAAKAVDEAADRDITRDPRFRRLSDALVATNKWRREPADPYYVRGAIIGVVDLVDVHRPLWDGSCLVEGEGACSRWGEADGWPEHLVLANPRALSEPIPYKGALGLRKTDFGVEGDWLVEYHEPCKHPCAGVYGCLPSCHVDPVARLVATS